MTARTAPASAARTGRSAAATAASGTRAALLESPAFAQDPRLARLLSLYAPAYQLAVRTLGTTRDAEDVVQQSYIKALSHLPDDLPEAEVQPWFFRITVNAARDFQRSEMRRKAREAGSAQGGSATPVEPPLPDGVTREMLGDLQGCLHELEERHRMPLVLCYEQGLSQNEAAHILDMPPRTLSKYLEDGLELLRQKMVGRGHTVAPALLIAAFAHGAPAVPIGLEAIAREVLRDAPAQAPAPAPAAPSAATPPKAGLHIGWKIAGVVVGGGVLFVLCLVALIVVMVIPNPSRSRAEAGSQPRKIRVGPEGVSIQDGSRSVVVTPLPDQPTDDGEIPALPAPRSVVPATPSAPAPANTPAASPGTVAPLAPTAPAAP